MAAGAFGGKWKGGCVLLVLVADLALAVASTLERDVPSNHFQETGAWEDNYKYSCQRRHVSIDALG